MGSNLRAWTDPGRAQRFLLLGIFLLLCLVVQDRYQLLDGFAVLHGDRYDAVIVATILEHWFHVLGGDATWSQVNYFFPYTRTIAQTDAYFLVGIAYSPFRLFGLDPFIATELASLVIKSSGFVGAYLLCRKAFSLSFYWALLAAILFTLSNGMTIHSQRIQLATVAFAPILTLLIWSAITAFLEGHTRKFRVMGLAAGLFYGAWCLTCFYMAWFFAFYFSAFAVVMLVRAGRPGWADLKTRLAACYGSVILVIGSAFVSLLPFIYAFLPKSRESGVRAYETVVANTIPIENILQVGYDNILYGHLYNRILSYLSPGYWPQGEYYNTGFTVLLFFLFLCGCIRFLRKPHQASTELVLPSLVIASVLTWLLTLNVSHHSAWFFVYELFPGAKALNVVAAYQIFLALPVVVIAVKYLSLKHIPLPVLLPLAALLVAGEINKPYLNLDRQAELARISMPHAPPDACRVFYVSGWEGQDSFPGFPEWINNYYAHNVSAMIIAQMIRIPTINGVASFNPPDWNFGFPNNPDYAERVSAYAKKHGLVGLCRLDLNSKQWLVVE
ncbi:MAG: hypothetical protein PHQ05_05270 [Sterolibacterium sp.]|nr:hypothetical protein [Sterolibacterium sp.]